MSLSRSVASANIEKLVARIYSLACAISGVEVLYNCWLERNLVNYFAIFSLLGFVFVIVGMVVAAWKHGDSRGWYRVHAVTVFMMVLYWPWQVYGSWPADPHPWVWWALGNAAISAGIGFSGWLAVMFQFALPALWVYQVTDVKGGAIELDHALSDAAYVLLLAATISSIIWAMRTRAKLADDANLRTAAALAEKNRLDALERETTAAAALVHTQVVAALDQAIEAETEAEWRTTASVAKEAELALEQRLNLADLENTASPLETWANSFCESIAVRYPSVLVEVEHVDGLTIPTNVAQALTEGALQAIDNSVRHAGSSAKSKVKIQGLNAGVKVLISDDGRGFRVNRESRGQIGIRRSIFERGESVGIQPKIDTQPGRGCRVSLTWVQA